MIETGSERTRSPERVVTSAWRASPPANRDTASARRRDRRAGFADYGFLAPALLLVAIVLLVPAAFTLVISFTEWNLIGMPQFVGVDNYVAVLSDPTARNALFNSVIWVIGGLALPVVGGLLLAVFLDAAPLQSVWKAVIYLPVIIAPTVTGAIWKQIYALDGPLNAGLAAIGLGDLAQGWLLESPLNTYLMVVTSTWRTIGPAMVLFLVGLQTIPKETVEAAMLDGASAWQVFTRIKLPQIRGISTVVVTMSVISSFATFDFVWVMTQGGPYQSSETLAVTIYRLAFGQWQVGPASALAIILGAISLVFSVIYIARGIERPGARKGARN